MKIKPIVIPFLLLLATMQLAAQPYSLIKDVNILADQKVVLERQFPHAFDTLELKEVVEIDDKHAIIRYVDKGIYCEAVVNRDREDMLLVANGVEVPHDQVPEIVLDALNNSEYSTWQIDKILAMSSPYGSWYYAIDVFQNDKKERIFFDNLGGYKKAPY